MVLNLIVFAGGIGLGAFGTVLLLALANKEDADIMTPEEYAKMSADWDEINDKYDVYSAMTVDELFGDLNDEEDE